MAPPAADAPPNATLPTPPPLPARTPDRFRLLAVRALTRRCPYCGARGIFDGYWSLKERCPRCGTSFAREDGYFLGAYALNLIVAEILGLGLALYLIFGTRLSRLPLLWQEAIAISLAVALPIVFFPFSRMTWMALDLLVDPPTPTPERRLRGHEMGRPPDRPS